MKRFVLSLALVFAFSFAAFAGVQDFGAYTVDVPEGWTAEQDGSTVNILKNDNSALLSITYDDAEGMSAADLAKAFSEQFGGSAPAKDGENYTFEFKNANGVASTGIVAVDSGSGKFVLFVITGAENAPEEISGMIGSLQDK